MSNIIRGLLNMRYLGEELEDECLTADVDNSFGNRSYSQI